MAKKKIKVVCYCRVSTSSKEQLNSFENQKEFFERFIKQHPEYTLYKSKECPTGIYADRGISGTLLHREQFELMLKAAGLIIDKVDYKDLPRKDADGNEVFITYRDYISRFSKEEPQFTLILVRNTSRFARNIMITDILRKLQALGVYVKFLDIDKSTENESDMTIIQFFQTFDEMFSRDLSRKLLSANQQSRENQILRTNFDLFGYQYHKRKNRSENNYLTIIEEEAFIIQMIFRLYLGCFYVDPNLRTDNPPEMIPCNFECSNCLLYEELKPNAGIGFRNIMQVLNYVYRFRTRKGKEFAQTTLKHIFENEKFAGYLNSGKWDHGPLFNKYSSPKIKDDYEDYLVYRPDLIPPIISKELFDLCTEKRKEKVEVFGGAVFKGTPTEYAGLIYCGECGSIMRHNKANNGLGFYNCKIKKTKGTEFCTNGNVFDYQIKEKIESLCNGGLNEWIELKIQGMINSTITKIEENLNFINNPARNTRLQFLNEQITKKTSALSKLYTKQALAETDDAAIGLAIKSIEDELPPLKEEQQLLNRQPSILLQECKKLLDVCYTGIYEIENPQETYTESELWCKVSHFIAFSETTVIRGGLHGRPKVTLLPVLKGSLDGMTEIKGLPVGLDYGIENKIFAENLKGKIEEIENTIKHLETLYF